MNDRMCNYCSLTSHITFSYIEIMMKFRSDFYCNVLKIWIKTWKKLIQGCSLCEDRQQMFYLNCSKNGVSSTKWRNPFKRFWNLLKLFWYCLGTTCLTFEEDPEPFGKERDQKIIKICKDLNIEVIQVVSHTLYKLEK